MRLKVMSADPQGRFPTQVALRDLLPHFYRRGASGLEDIQAVVGRQGDVVAGMPRPDLVILRLDLLVEERDVETRLAVDAPAARASSRG